MEFTQLKAFDTATISVVAPRQLHNKWWCLFGIAAAVAGAALTGGAGIIGGAALIYATCH